MKSYFGTVCCGVAFLALSTSLFSQTYPIVGAPSLVDSESSFYVIHAPQRFAGDYESTLAVDATIPAVRSDDQSTIHFILNGSGAAQDNKTFRFKTTITSPRNNDTLGSDSMGFAYWNTNGICYPNVMDCCFFKDGHYALSVDSGKLASNIVFPYLENIYKDSIGNLLGFLHVEDHRACPDSDWTCNAYSIALAFLPHSTLRDTSEASYNIWLKSNWVFLGSIINTHLKYADYYSSAYTNIGGVPYVVSGDSNFYVYYTDFDTVAYLPTFLDANTSEHPGYIGVNSVARAKISDVMNYAANNDSAPPSIWKKYTGDPGCAVLNDSCWTGDALTGEGKAVIPEPNSLNLSQISYYSSEGYVGVDSLQAFNDCLWTGGLCLENQTDAIYSTVTHKYYMLMEGIVNGEGTHSIYLYHSSDGVNFSDTTTLIFSGQSSDNFYPSIVPANWTDGTDDFREVGDQFKVIYYIQGNPSYTSGLYWITVTLPPS